MFFKDPGSEPIFQTLIFQAGPLFKVNIPMDAHTKQRKNFGFVRFQHAESVPYAIELFRGIKLFGQSLTMQNRKTGAGMQTNQNERVQHHQRPQRPPQQPQFHQDFSPQQGFQPPFLQQQYLGQQHLHQQQQGFQRGYHDQRDHREYNDRRDSRDHYDRRDQHDRSRFGQQRNHQEDRRHHSYDRDDRSQHHHNHDYRDRNQDYRDRSHDRRYHDRQSNQHRRY